MESPSPKSQPAHKGHAKPIEDPEAIRAKQASAIGHILPEAKNDPELYQRVVDTLNDSQVGRALRWSEYRPVKNFYAWCSMTDDEARPPLHNFLALLAAHRCLSRTFNDKFTQLVKSRKLVQWAQQELRTKQPDSQTGNITMPKKEDDGDHSVSDLTPVAQSSHVSREKVIPSVENRPRLPAKQPTNHRPHQGSSWLDDEPFPPGTSMKRKASSEYEQKEASRTPKTAWDYHGHHRAKVSTRDSATQTDEYTPKISDGVLSAIKEAIGEAMDQKIVECLPAALREANRLNAEDEAARQQSDTALLARVMRAAEPHMALTRQIPPAYVAPAPALAHEQPRVFDMMGLQYEDVRPVALNPRGRILPTEGQGRRLGLFQ